MGCKNGVCTVPEKKPVHLGQPKLPDTRGICDKPGPKSGSMNEVTCVECIRINADTEARLAARGVPPMSDKPRVNWGEVQVARDQLREAADILDAIDSAHAWNFDPGVSGLTPDRRRAVAAFFADRIVTAAEKIQQALEAGADSPAPKGRRP